MDAPHRAGCSVAVYQPSPLVYQVVPVQFCSLPDAYAAQLQPLIEAQALKAALVHEDALEAVKGEGRRVSCSSCGELSVVKQGVPDWHVRLRAGATILKACGFLDNFGLVGSREEAATLEEILAKAVALEGSRSS